jgi:hypothetical protein
LQKKSAEPFDACPYCLTRITVIQLEPDNEPENITDEQIHRKEKLTQNREKPLACKYHLGYLSEREQREQIPDECICCKDILECMLRKMRQ